MDTSTVNVGCLTEHIERAMGLLGEVVLTPTFPEEEFEKLRKQVLTSLAVSSAEPDYVADKEFRRKLFDDHPYSRTATGEVEDVNVLVIEDLKQWWGKFARPDTAVLIFSGDIGEKEAFKLAEKTFGGWKAAGERPDIKISKVAEPAETHIYLVDMPGSTQSQIRVGQHGITRHDERYFVSRIVSNYFGWAYNSRLNESIRVAKGLTYGVWGSYTANRFAGEFEVGTFSKTESTAKAVKAVLEEINRLKTEGPSDKELEDSRSYILGSFVRGRETPQQIAGDLWLIESQGLDKNYLERLLSGIAKTEQADCEHLVQQTIEPGKLVIVVVGEAEKLKEGLKKIAPVTVVSSKAL
jgi:predicted Zn-dependent peptidase